MNEMSIIDFIKSFLVFETPVLQFSENICIEMRKLYGVKKKDIISYGEELFMVAGLFNPDADKADYELAEQA